MKLWQNIKLHPPATADPGFPGGEANTFGCVNLLFGQISQKQHESEEIWTERGAVVQNFAM